MDTDEKLDRIINLLERLIPAIPKQEILPIAKEAPPQVPIKVDSQTEVSIDSQTEISNNSTLVQKQTTEEEQSWIKQMETTWPKSVPDELICNHLVDSQKKQRASDILDIIVVYGIRNKFLDFGCGENHVAQEARNRGAQVSIGYDIKENFDVCNNWQLVKQQGPYDTVLLYDVLDHCESPEEIMQMIADVTTNDSQIYVSTHPWLSRHGGHTYTRTNKAFIHLFLPNINEIYCNKTLTDFGTYQRIFNNNNFYVSEFNTRSDKVDKYFLTDPNTKKFLENLANNLKCSLPQLVWTMRHSFYDFIITKNAPAKSTSIYPIAICHHIADNSNHYFNTLYSNGKVYNDLKQIPNHPIGTWTIENKTVFMKWPDETCRDGQWIDTCLLSEDLQSYSGSNQSGVEINGEII